MGDRSKPPAVPVASPLSSRKQASALMSQHLIGNCPPPPTPVGARPQARLLWPGLRGPSGAFGAGRAPRHHVRLRTRGHVFDDLLFLTPTH